MLVISFLMMSGKDLVNFSVLFQTPSCENIDYVQKRFEFHHMQECTFNLSVHL